MKALPRRLTRDAVTFTPYFGEGAYGPVTVLGKVSWTRQFVRDANGAEVVSDVTVHLHPDDATDIVPGAIVTIGDYASFVLSVAPESRPGETVLVRVTCR